MEFSVPVNAAGLILLIDREVNDLFLLQHALKSVGIRNPIKALSSLREGRQYLVGAGHFADRARHPLPILIVLDLTFTTECAVELLRSLRKIPELQNVPVIAMVSAQRSLLAQQAYDAGANAVFTKGIELAPLAETIRDLDFLEDLLVLKPMEAEDSAAA